MYLERTFRLILIVFVDCVLIDVGSLVVVSYKEMLSGETAHLECDIEADEDDGWSHIPVGSDERVDVMAGRTPNVNYGDRFSIDHRENYDLVIVDVQLQDAGTYICRRPPYEQVIRYNLTVLDISPVCSSEEVQPVVAENSCGTKPSSISLFCRLKYSGVVSPVLEWIGIDGKNLSRNGGEDTNVVVNTVHTTVKWDTFTFTCQTKESNKSCHAVITKPMYAFNTTEKRTISSPQTVTCSANSSQQCSYKWIREGEEVQSLDNTLELVPGSLLGEYQCLAECQFHERLCVIQALLLTYAPSSNIWNMNHLLIYTNIATAIAALLVGGFLKKCLQRRSIVRIIVRIISKRITNSYCYLQNKIFGCSDRGRHKNNEENGNLLQESSLGIKWEDVTPKRIHINRKCEDPGTGQIKALTLLNGVIYVIRHAVFSIERYYVASDNNLDPIPIPQLKEARDLASCAKSDAIYISSNGYDMVVKLFVEDIQSETWHMNSSPEGLHVLDSTEVLVVFPKEKTIRKFNSNGDEIIQIKMPDNIVNPHHAILNNHNEMVICYGRQNDRKQGIVFVNEAKRVDGVNNGFPNMWPIRMVQTKDGHVLVISYTYQKILLLNSKLEFIRTLLECGFGDTDMVGLPNRMFLDEDNKLLYVSENTDRARTLTYKLE